LKGGPAGPGIQKKEETATNHVVCEDNVVVASNLLSLVPLGIYFLFLPTYLFSFSSPSFSTESESSI